MKCPTEIAITDRREKELADWASCRWCTARARITPPSSASSRCQKPKTVRHRCGQCERPPFGAAAVHHGGFAVRALSEGDDARQDRQLHVARRLLSAFLNRWIAEYVTPDDKAIQAIKAKFPLREARIEVEEVTGKPGVYRAVAFLRPHFQLDELTVSLRSGG